MDKSEQISKSWTALFERAERSRIGLFVGAGLSVPSKFPKWPDLTAELCDPNKDVVRVQQLQACGVSLVSQLAIAGDRGKETGDRHWIDRVRDGLYGAFFRKLQESHGLKCTDLKEMEHKNRSDQTIWDFFEKTNPSLAHVVSMCAVRTREGKFVANPRVGAVLTTNLDALLQLCDRRDMDTHESCGQSSDPVNGANTERYRYIICTVT